MSGGRLLGLALRKGSPFKAAGSLEGERGGLKNGEVTEGREGDARNAKEEPEENELQRTGTSQDPKAGRRGHQEATGGTSCSTTFLEECGSLRMALGIWDSAWAKPGSMFLCSNYTPTADFFGSD
ncbi:hypothetical protein NDU88_001995 [Pleurodeles waltl]|uniref:Uncharacterized protein n=1 Tax=Pleurodeles waltl TaxID=8319 RepID=A0AAV7NCD0_PLEWA|nr:hypothetical protein NDU88_001995 [Pleurodeles waltl]